jgi:hypothetical protein
MADMSYVDAQVQDTSAFSSQNSFGAFIVGNKTVGKARDVAASASSTASAEGAQSVTPTAAKGGSAYGADSELAMSRGSSPAMPAAVNWPLYLGIGAAVVAVLGLVLMLFKRR